MTRRLQHIAVCLSVVVSAGVAVAQEPTSAKTLDLSAAGQAAANTPPNTVDLSGSVQILAKDVAAACRVPGLRQLRLDGATVDQRGWPYLAAAKDLEVLTLAGARIPSVDPVLETVRDLPKLRRLDISRLAPSRRALENLVGLPALQELVVSNLDPESAEVVSRIKGLKSLTVQGSSPGAAGWAAIGELGLESLTIRDSELQDEHMRFIVGISSLKELALPEYSLSETAYAKLARLTELRALDVSARVGATGEPYGGVTQAALREIAAACTKLESLNINYCAISDLTCLKGLANLSRLDAERLQGTLQVGTVEEMLSGTTGLEVAIFPDTALDHEVLFLRGFRALPHLKVLAVGNFGGAGWRGNLMDMDGQPTLEELDAFGLGYHDHSVGSVDSFPKLPKLLRAKLVRCDVADAALTDLSSLPVVVKVSLLRCRLTGKQGLGSFRKNDSIVWLNLDGVDFQDKSLVGVQNLQALRRLDLSDTNLSGDMLDPVGQVGTLRWLNLARCRVVNSDLRRFDGFPPLAGLSLAGTDITDQGLVHLVKLTKLEQLNLSDTRITDEAVDQLASLSSLKRLDVTGTRMSGDGIARLAGRLPACKLGKYED